ncbi:hypothetical protein BGZ99_008426 [Dissophora globulifera]|uniref:Uncharacterized protein n=1 Tax=Dissophora globulifera TaxID=979702 RepID=A0A9P6RB10_9FUNG|nr:hypothetical protein BGZ99_008426 [Dissophora globulifera]
MSLDPSSLHSQDLKPTPDPLPMDRFSAMVDLIFDPNIVRLNHRRAIINCARYVSASIDESFLKAVSTHDPQDPDFHILFQRQHTVDLGPYLTVTSPVHYNSDGSAFSSRDQALVDAGRDHLRSTRISPPRRMHNYFQVMLWDRCMNDLISLFNRVQRRHVETTEALGAPEGQRYFEASEACRMCSAAPSSITSDEAVHCQHHHHQAEPLAAKTTAAMPDIYPFCCKAHSLVFSSQYPLSFVPYPLRVQIRRVVQKVQSVSRKSIWTNVFDSITNLTGNNNSNNSSSNASYHSSDNSNSHYPDRMPTRGSTIQYTGPTRKLQFCSDAAHSYSHSHSHSTFSPSGKQSTKGDDEEELIQRRYRIEERIRQDNLEKQELLSLCHMACGLFLSDDQSLDAPPTIMSLLRQGSPWNRGVWSEGEWLYSPIDVYPQRRGHTPCKSGSSSQKDENWSDSQSRNQSSKVDTMDMGCWQRVCIETIQFLAHEDLAWGGNRTNAELSRLRASSNASAWIYHE